MNKNRIEAFSDGVIAIIITIMVLELRIPDMSDAAGDGEMWNALMRLLPKLFAYLLSFIVVAILWLNHHALFDRIPHSTSKLVWYNMFLLFAMSLIPLPTAFIAAHATAPHASAFYGAVMFLTAFAFFWLRRYVEVGEKMIPVNTTIQTSNIIATSLYLFSIPLAYVSVYASFVIFIGIPLWYFLPDKLHRNPS